MMLTCCARSPFPCSFHCWPQTWTPITKQHWKRERQVQCIRAVWPKLSVLNSCFFFFVPFLGLFLLWNQTEMLATQATAFPAGRFQYINMPENAVVSCLFYPSLQLSASYTVSGDKRPVTHSELWNNSKR